MVSARRLGRVGLSLGEGGGGRPRLRGRARPTCVDPTACAEEEEGALIVPVPTTPRAGSTTAASSSAAAVEAAAAGELHGRKATDATLWFTLAGTDDATLYDGLVEVSKDVLHVVWRGGGGSRSRLGELYHVAVDCLDVKMTGGGGGSTGPPSRQRGPGDNDDVDHSDVDDDADDDDDDDDGGVEDVVGIDYGSIVSSLRDGTFGMHSDRPLLGLWRFSMRQTKQRAFFRNAARHSDG